ncbi:MAG TPA: FUSC family protein [Thermoplasmata archaeon]|nr:FUSC family protein [Thermoplasmata archaeon]
MVDTLFRLDRDRFDLTYGVRAGVFTVIPLLIGIAEGYVTIGVLVALGALNLMLVQAPRPGRTPYAVLALAVGTDAIAWGAGTLVGSMSGPLEWTLLGVGVFGIMLSKRYSLFNQLALITAVMYVVSAGLPGGWDVALPHAVLILVGGAWGLFGAVLPTWVRWIERPLPASAHLSPAERVPVGTTVSFAFAVAATVAIGYATAQSVGLPRDYWVMLTILAALRPELAGTFSIATMRGLGTIAGAAIVFGLTLAVSNVWVLAILIVVAASITFAVRAVNYIVYAVFLTIYMIVLLALAYHGGPAFAVDRVIDTIIGCGFAIAAGLALSAWKGRLSERHRPPVGSVPPHAV